MAEPKTRAERMDELYPWLLHWSIADDRLGGFRSDAYALRTPEGLIVIDALPLAAHLEEQLASARLVLMTHGNHQRSAWRFRREFGAEVCAPRGAAHLDESPDVWFDAESALPDGLEGIAASAFSAACYLSFTHADGTRALFCGDLICQDPKGPYRFPDQPGYFDPAEGKEDARRLLEVGATVLCPAHATPSRDGGRDALEGALALV